MRRSHGQSLVLTSEPTSSKVMSSIQTVPAPVSITPKAMLVLSCGTSRTRAYSCQSVVPSIGLLQELSKSQGALNYFDLLAPPEFHGRTISEYHKRFEGEESVEALKLSVHGRPYKGQTRKIEWTDSKVLLTVLVEGEMPPTAL